MMYKRVVVPLDGSPLAETALPYAEEIATRMGSEIILLTVLPCGDSEEYRDHDTYISSVIGSTRQKIIECCEMTGRKAIGVGSATRNGDAAQGILSYVNRGYSCLLVMATHGRSGLSRWAIGSVADKVVRSTLRQPLLLIRARGKATDVKAGGILKKMLVPLDGSLESEAVIPYLSRIALSLNTSFTLFRVITGHNHTADSAEAYLRNWCQHLRKEGITAEYKVRAGAAAEQIIDYAGKRGFDLVAMSTRGQTGITRWALGSVAQKVLLGGNTPLLLIRA
ncbi:MAG: hypothetical protein A2Z29_06905 [Chloroflexi bacterium RBG_16_56_11]|nr:MAG: hypothetical protein A2Z29_06905 [Chloroflexi bacterium RBG_16_56_11]